MIEFARVHITFTFVTADLASMLPPASACARILGGGCCNPRRLMGRDGVEVWACMSDGCSCAAIGGACSAAGKGEFAGVY